MSLKEEWFDYIKDTKTPEFQYNWWIEKFNNIVKSLPNVTISVVKSNSIDEEIELKAKFTSDLLAKINEDGK